MALERLGEALDAAEMRTERSEAAKLPERLEAPIEADGLPEKLEGAGTVDKLPELSNERKDAGTIPERPEVWDDIWEEINDTLSSPEGIKALTERHPEKAELWQSQQQAMEMLNDPMATDAERRSAQSKLSSLKGQMMETAVKDALSDAGLTVETKQRLVEGQDGGTRPDVIARNDTDQSLQVFGKNIAPGETMSIECKCGGKVYLDQQLHDHIPNQLSGQIGHKVLLTTADIRYVDPSLVKNTCEQYDAALVVLDVKVSDVEKAIKGVTIS